MITLLYAMNHVESAAHLRYGMCKFAGFIFQTVMEKFSADFFFFFLSAFCLFLATNVSANCIDFSGKKTFKV